MSEHCAVIMYVWQWRVASHFLYFAQIDVTGELQLGGAHGCGHGGNEINLSLRSELSMEL